MDLGWVDLLRWIWVYSFEMDLGPMVMICFDGFVVDGCVVLGLWQIPMGLWWVVDVFVVLDLWRSKVYGFGGGC